MNSGEHQHLVFMSFQLDLDDERLRLGARVVPLRPKTFAVLRCLVERPGRLVRKEDIKAAVWPQTFVSDTVLKVCIRELRRALDDHPHAPRCIETAYGRGYRFIAPIERT
jgi:DNA-binding winged helix-turn-helix (wHTH) protein